MRGVYDIMVVILAIGICCVGIGVGCAILYYKYIYIPNLITKLNISMGKKIEEKMKGSRAVVKGQVYEQMVPLLSDFPYHPADARFLGSPIDLVIFKGMAEDKITDVVFMEVKTGNSSLSSRQQQIKRAIKLGKVRFETWKGMKQKGDSNNGSVGDKTNGSNTEQGNGTECDNRCIKTVENNG